MIPAELGQLLEPLERFETIRRRVARLGARLADLSYANPYEPVGRAARRVLREALAEERPLDLQYTPFGGQVLARRAAADALRASHGLQFAFDDVVLTPGAMAALQIALRASGEAGEEVVIPTPCWLDYPLYVSSLGLVPRLVDMPPERFDLDVETIMEAVGPRTCAVVVGQPANPTGRSYGARALSELAAALRKADSDGEPVTLIADETHRDFIEPDRYRSAAEFYDRTLLVYSFGKYHFIQGQRLGYAAVSPRHPDRAEVARELARWTRIAGFATPTALMQRALPALLGLEHDHAWVPEWRARVVATLSDRGYSVTEPDGTLFVYAATPRRFADDFAFVERLAERGVLVLPAPVFHHRGHFRLSLTGSEPMLERALEVLGEEAAE